MGFVTYGVFMCQSSRTLRGNGDEGWREGPLLWSKIEVHNLPILCWDLIYKSLCVVLCPCALVSPSLSSEIILFYSRVMHHTSARSVPAGCLFA